MGEIIRACFNYIFTEQGFYPIRIYIKYPCRRIIIDRYAASGIFRVTHIFAVLFTEKARFPCFCPEPNKKQHSGGIGTMADSNRITFSFILSGIMLKKVYAWELAGFYFD